MTLKELEDAYQEKLQTASAALSNGVITIDGAAIPVDHLACWMLDVAPGELRALAVDDRALVVTVYPPGNRTRPANPNTEIHRLPCGREVWFSGHCQHRREEQRSCP
jgi:hypothetical protein